MSVAQGPFRSELAKLAGFLTDVLAAQEALEELRLAISARGLVEEHLQATNGHLGTVTNSIHFAEAHLDGVVTRLERAMRECVGLPFVEPGFDDVEPVERDPAGNALASDGALAGEDGSPCTQAKA